MYNLPDNCQLSISRVVSNEEVAQNETKIKRLVVHRMHDELKDFLLRHRLTQEGKCFSTVFRLEVLVFSPDEFAQIVHDEARRLMSLMKEQA